MTRNVLQRILQIENKNRQGLSRPLNDINLPSIDIHRAARQPREWACVGEPAQGNQGADGSRVVSKTLIYIF